MNTFEQIENQIKNTKTLSLSPEIVRQDFYKSLTKLFKQQNFSIKECQNIARKDNQLTFNGTFEKLFSWENIEVNFYLFDYLSERHSIFQITPPADLTADDYFVQYQIEPDRTEPREIGLDYYVEKIEFTKQNRNIVVASVDLPKEQLDTTIQINNLSSSIQEIKEGLNFPVNLQIDNDVSGLFSKILGGIYTEESDCTGLIYLKDSSPYFNFSKAIDAQKSFGLLTFALNEIAMSFPLTHSSEIFPEVSVNGSIKVNNNTVFSVTASLDLYYQILSITLTQFPTLGEWIKLLNIGTLNDYFPDTLASLLNIKLSELRIFINLPNESVPELSLSVTTQDDIVLIADIISLKPSLNLTFYDPFNSKSLEFEGELQGIWHLGSTQFETSMRYPDMTFYAAMSQGQTLDVSAMAERIFSGIELPKIEFTRMELWGNYREKSFSVNLEITGDWDITQSITLTQIQMSMARYGDGSGSDYTISAEFRVANMDVFVIADYDTTSGGWEFKGSTGHGQAIPIGPSDGSSGKPNLTDDLGSKFGAVNLPEGIAELSIQNLGISFNTKTKNFTFICKAEFPIEGKEVDITVNINIIQQQDGSYNKHFDGHITIGDLQFALIFDTDKTSKTFLAAYHDEHPEVSIKQLISYLDSDLAKSIPKDLKISLKDALFAFSQKASSTTKNFLFGLNIGGAINLSNLPLVGKKFAPNQTIKSSFQILFARAIFTSDEIGNLNKLYTEGGISLPEQKVAKGLNLATSMQLGSETKQLSLPVVNPNATDQNNALTETRSESDSDSSSSPSPASSDEINSPDGTKWYKLQKAFGPVHFERIGLNYKDSKIWFLLDAELSLAGLSISLDGLSVKSPITKIEPEFDLKGIGIDYKSGSALEIGAAFLRQQGTTPDGKTYDEYDGTAVIKAETFTLSAIGSYAEYEGHPSLFIYAVLDYPLGGPSFFFVTGVAAGFGYNRALKMPTIDKVATFPLVEEAVNPNQSSSSQDNAAKLTQELDKIHQYIPPETGEIFLAVGVKFTSFKIIDSFALLSIAFGKRFELNLLGLSTLLAPPEAGKTPLAEVQLAIKASFLPAVGFLGIRAQLTPNSYILSKKCHLTGGFAFYTWFSPNEHEGDFVLTLGGYHPKFKVPAHYPKVPRLGFNWQVNSEINIKADAYFALTASALMAGGHLQATWHSGSLRAWFKLGADFIISWKPYYYDASISVDMGVSYTFHFFGTHHISIDVGADLHIWGPEFTGKAHIHLWIISFTVSFGANASQTPTPIDWNTFKSSFLPADDTICSVAVKDGLVRKVNQDDKSDLGVINPKHFCLVTNSVIPIKNAVYRRLNDSTPINIDIGNANTKFGIGSMEVKSGELTSTQIVTISKDGTPLTEVEFQAEFECNPILKKAPTGLWGESLTPDLNSEQFIENTLSGFEIKPKEEPKPGETHAVNRQDLQFTTESVNNAYEWETIKVFNEEEGKDIRETITESSVKTARENLLRAMNLDLDIREIDLSENIADNFLLSPKIGALT
ncbi:MAG: hypothetical protein F6K40_19155 [Okeania sp. SIO3I5]|nr:hypothetical protein [Okeania sp. SIO3I5]